MAWSTLTLNVGACSSDEPSVSAPETWPKDWHVRDGFVRDADGRAVLLRGVNLSGSHKNAPYLGFHLAPDYARVRSEWGMNAIRFLMTWSAVEPLDGVFDEAYLDEVALRMDWAHQAGLLVILDMHQDVYGEGFGGDGAPRWTCDESRYEAFVPQTPWFFNYLDENVAACFDQLWTSEALQDRFANAWVRVAERLSGHPAVVGFDVLNEPHWGSYGMGAFERDRLQSFYEKVVLAVRGVAPTWLAFLEPSAGRNIGVATSLSRFPFGNVVYAPHSYDASAEQGNGFSEASRGAILQKLIALAQEARELDAALWIGEYGGMVEDPGFAAYMDAQYDGAASVAAGTMYWSYDRAGGYGMLAPDGSDKPALLDAVIRPCPERIAGTPIDWSYEESTRTLTVRWTPDARVTAPTVIAAPQRVYPDGLHLTCDRCEFEVKDGSVEVTKPPEGSPATLTIAP
jgi:endoglycosylceramidase